MQTVNTTSFVLKNSSEGFNQRQKDVFDQLNKLQCNLQNNVSVDEDMDIDEVPIMNRKQHRSVMKQFRGKESIFKRPQEPIKKNYMKTIPDFKKNPHKWKKYSLADVRDEDMSETCNTKTALSFLNELKNRNCKQLDNAPEQPQKIVFRKKSSPVQNIRNSEQDLKPSFSSSKVVMPEYVVGEKVVKEKKCKKMKDNTNTSQLKLDHLYEEYD